MTDPVDPPIDTTAQRKWALDIVSRRRQLVGIVSGPTMLRNAARVLGQEHVDAMEKYIHTYETIAVAEGRMDPPDVA